MIEQSHRDNTVFVEVILPLPLPNTFTYAVDTDKVEEIDIGKRVVVPFGKKKIYSGIIKDVSYTSPTGYEVKPIIEVLDEQRIVENRHLELWQWMSNYYMCHLGEIMNAALPSGFKVSSETVVSVIADYEEGQVALSETEEFLFKQIFEKKTITVNELVDRENKSSKNLILKTVEQLLTKGVVDLYDEVKMGYKPKLASVLKLNPLFISDEERQKLFDKLEKNEKQLEVFIRLFELTRDKDSIFKNDFFSNNPSLSRSALDTLKKKQIVLEEKVEISRLQTTDSSEQSPELNTEQAEALKEILTQFESKNTVLLFGVTSSGKTIVYQKLMEHFLQQGGGQILFLVPEIALTTQLVRRIQKTFSYQVVAYHSGLSAGERVEIWNKVKDGECKVILGARSALFLPFSKLDLIIVDEEHEASYKQNEPAPRYQARDTAIWMAYQCQAKVLLGSATPSVESYHQAQQGKYGLVKMLKRFENIPLPKIEIVHFNKTPLSEKRSYLFEEDLLNSIEQTVKRKEQVILFQNKRGFSPVVMCKGCGYYHKCKSCDVAMTYHSFSGMLVCHYCNYQQKPLLICPVCGSISWDYRGFGTQKLEEEIQGIFPERKVFRFDSDTARGKKKLTALLEKMENSEIDILIGTQMLAKGLDFSKAHLTGVICADHLWQNPHYRAAERTFQLLSQVSGRVGRRGKQGHVIVQAFDINNSILSKVQRHDYEAFFEEEIEERKAFIYPPFCSLIQVVLKNRDVTLLKQQAQRFFEAVHAIYPDNITQPVEPSISRIKNLYIRQTTMKFPRNANVLSNAKKNILQITQQLLIDKSFKGCLVTFNVDV